MSKFTSFLRGRHTRGAVYTAVSVLILLAVLLVNISINAAKLALNSYIDLTPEELYTLSDELKSEIGGITDEVTVTFCADPDVLLGNYETRYIYIMLRAIEQMMPNIQVVTHNVKLNPTAVQQYRTTSASTIDWNQIIVSCGQRYRILSASAFWSFDSTGGDYWAYNGEYKIATALLSITAVSRPVAYFTVGHGERVYDPENELAPGNAETRAFYHLLLDQGLEVKTLRLDEVEAIPEDCVLLIMNGPERDYTPDPAGTLADNSWYYLHDTSPVEKLDRYLDEAGAMMIFKNPDAVLPVLEEYLREWGIRYVNGLTVKDARRAMPDVTAAEGERSKLIAVYPDKSANAIGYSLFSDIADLTAAPKTIVADTGYLLCDWVDNSKYISNYTSAMNSAVLLSSPSAVAYNAAGARADEAGNYTLASITARVYTEDVADYYSYVFSAATTRLTSSDYLDNSTYANYDVLFSAVRTISRVDAYAGDALGGLNMNSEKYGGKQLITGTISDTDEDIYKNGKVIFTYLGLTESGKTWWTLLILLPVFVLPVLGIVRFVRRKNR